MDTLLARLTDLAYEFFGILLPGLVGLMALLLFWVSLGDLAPSSTSFPLGLAADETWSAMKDGGTVPWTWAIPALAASYFLGHLLKWLSKQWWWCGQSRPSRKPRIDRTMPEDLKKAASAFNAGRYGEAQKAALEVITGGATGLSQASANHVVAWIGKCASAYDAKLKKLDGPSAKRDSCGLRKLDRTLRQAIVAMEGTDHAERWRKKLDDEEAKEDFRKALEPLWPPPKSARFFGASTKLLRSLLIAPEQPKDHHSRSLTGLVSWLADSYKKKSGYQERLDWSDLFPVARACILQRGRKSLLLTFQSNYTLHRSLATLATAFMWASPISLLWGWLRGVHPSLPAMLAFLAVSLVCKQVFTANYRYFWSKWGDHMVAEAYALEVDRGESTSVEGSK